MTNDEVSYIALARMFASGEPWAHHLATFPPLFPLLLAATGSAHDLLRAHVVVAAFALAALPLLYRFALGVLARRDAALAVVVAFLLTPAAWLDTWPTCEGGTKRGSRPGASSAMLIPEGAPRPSIWP